MELFVSCCLGAAGVSGLLLLLTSWILYLFPKFCDNHEQIMLLLTQICSGILICSILAISIIGLYNTLIIICQIMT